MSGIIAAFSAEQVKQLTGLSVSQLREWDNDRFFQPSLAIQNRRLPLSRIYSFEDVVGLRTLALLRKDHHISRQHLRRAADKLKEHSGKPWSTLTLYVLKGEVHFKNPQTGQVEGAVTGQMAVPIPLSSIAEDMRMKAEQLRRRDPSTVGHIDQHRFTMRGTPVVAGTRIPVSTIKTFADSGYSVAQIIEQYPSLSPQDVEAALAYDKLTHVA